jgi:hypothetical protein
MPPVSRQQLIRQLKNTDCSLVRSNILNKLIELSGGNVNNGDPLDPDGDLKTMDAIYQHLVDNGTLVWGAPVGHDALVWNAHRVYGKIRLPLLFSGFNELEWIDFDREYLLNLPLSNNSVNPVVVLQKK